MGDEPAVLGVPMTSHDRRSVAAALGMGFIAPGLARAMSHPLKDADGASIVAAMPPSLPQAGEIIETARDLYRRMTAPVSTTKK